MKARVLRILQDLAKVGQRLMERTAARRRRLDDGAGPALPLDQAFGLQAAQRLPHRKTADPIARAQLALGWKRVHRNRTAQHFVTQFISQLLITRLFGIGMGHGTCRQNNGPLVRWSA